MHWRSFKVTGVHHICHCKVSFCCILTRDVMQCRVVFCFSWVSWWVLSTTDLNNLTKHDWNCVWRCLLRQPSNFTGGDKNSLTLTDGKLAAVRRISWVMSAGISSSVPATCRRRGQNFTAQTWQRETATVVPLNRRLYVWINIYRISQFYLLRTRSKVSCCELIFWQSTMLFFRRKKHPKLYSVTTTYILWHAVSK